MNDIRVRRISDALKVKAELIPDRIAHDAVKRALTFREWDRLADEVAGGLAAAGLKRGDRVFLAISMDNAIEMAIAAIATMRAGGIAAPVNTRLSKDEFLDYSRLLEPRFAITDVPEKIADLTFERTWPAHDMPRDLAALPDQAGFEADGDAAIIGTSGTTGRPKGVVLGHSELATGAADGTRYSRRTNPALHSMPFTGYGGFTGQCLRPIYDGQTSLILYPFDTDELLRLIELKQPVSLMLVPTMLRLMLDHPAVTQTDMSSVKVIVTGTAPVPLDTLERAQKLWPSITIRNAYAMSEGGFGVIASTPSQLAKPGCVGQLTPNMEIRDENGAPAPPGVVGEIYGKPSGKPRRYWAMRTPAMAPGSMVGRNPAISATSTPMAT
ncbi:MAG: acyl--CoA ligase [Caulobacteraceae bacterium]|nr:acyl--CoA ligase [Caulobacteraceae bacterium]